MNLHLSLQLQQTIPAQSRKILSLIPQPLLFVDPLGSIHGYNIALIEVMELPFENLLQQPIFILAPTLNLINWRAATKAIKENPGQKRQWDLLRSDEKINTQTAINSFLKIGDQTYFVFIFQPESPPLPPRAPSPPKPAKPIASSFNNELELAQFSLQYSNEMIFWTRVDGGFYFVNEAAARNLGYTQEELVNLQVFAIAPEFPPEKWNSHWQTLQECRYMEVETTMQKKDGTQFPAYSEIHLIDFHGEEYNISFVRNLKRKKERDRFIELARLSLEQSPDLIFWCDRAGKVIYMNQHAQQFLQTHHKNQPLSKIQDLLFQEEQPVSSNFFQQVIQTNTRPQLQLKAEGQQVLPVEAEITALHQAEDIIYCLNLTDISQRLEQEVDLKEAFEKISNLTKRLQEEKHYLQTEINTQYSFQNIITRSPRYRKTLEQVAQVADSEATVLILGETGTGKELLAHAIHNLSERSERAMIKVNCATLPENLIESELFGHEKGAFTGAYQQKIGRFELADQGTIFLDEIGEMPFDLQAKLLRVLQEGEFRRLGGTQNLKVDTRVIAATNRNLEAMVANGTFREDLYYRLNVFPIRNIPLRERKEDIPILVKHFIEKHQKKMGQIIKKIPSKAMETLIEHDFPGNIRELENIVERALVMSNKGVLNLESILPQIKKQRHRLPNKFLSFEEMQRQHIINALERTHWRVSGKSGAARLLKMNDKTLASKMRKLDIHRPDIND